MNFRNIAMRSETTAIVVEAQTQVMVMWTRAVEWGEGKSEAFEILSGGRSIRTC